MELTRAPSTLTDARACEFDIARELIAASTTLASPTDNKLDIILLPRIVRSDSKVGRHV